MSRYLFGVAIVCAVVAGVFCARLIARVRGSTHDEVRLEDENRWTTIACLAIIGALGFLILSILA